MSLTAQLRDPSSPVGAWFRRRLGATTTVARTANRQLRARSAAPTGRIIDLAPHTPPVPALGDVALIGHAVDWLLRLSLVDEPPGPHSAAGLGARRVAGHDQQGRCLQVFSEASARCDDLAPARQALPAANWRELCRLCLLLAWLERGYRAALAPAAILERVDTARTLDEWMSQLVSPVDLQGLELLGRVALQDHEDVRYRRPLIANPTFTLSAALGGADADLIAGATLLDFKSTATIRIVGNLDLWQLVGYALADHHDEYAIAEVAISALRWRGRVTWPLESLLGQLAGAPLSIADARSEFATVLQAA